MTTIARPRRDRRYTVRREWCGHAQLRHVIRFCGEWLDQARTRTEAATLLKAHQAARLDALTPDKETQP